MVPASHNNGDVVCKFYEHTANSKFDTTAYLRVLQIAKKHTDYCIR